MPRSAINETEAEFQSWVIDTARLRHWRVAHFRPAKTEKGWRTAVQADGKGFVDLVMVRAGRLIFAELKSQKAPPPDDDQQRWIIDLFEVALAVSQPDNPLLGPVQVYLWRPSDRPEIEKVLA